VVNGYITVSPVKVELMVMDCEKSVVV